MTEALDRIEGDWAHVVTRPLVLSAIELLIEAHERF